METLNKNPELIPAGDLCESMKKISKEDLNKIEELSADIAETIGGGINKYHYAAAQQ